MLALKGPISFDRKTLPPSVYKFNCAFIIFCAVWFIVSVPIMVTIGIIYDESYTTFAVMIAGFSSFFIGLFVFYLVSYKMRKILIAERTDDLEKEFCDMPLQEAEEILKQRKIIDDNGFIIQDVFQDNSIPFENAKLIFDYYVEHTFLNINLTITDKKDLNVNRLKRVIVVDGAVFNYLIKKCDKLNSFFNLLKNDKNALANIIVDGGEKLQRLVSFSRGII